MLDELKKLHALHKLQREHDQDELLGELLKKHTYLSFDDVDKLNAGDNTRASFAFNDLIKVFEFRVYRHGFRESKFIHALSECNEGTERADFLLSMAETLLDRQELHKAYEAEKAHFRPKKAEPKKVEVKEVKDMTKAELEALAVALELNLSEAKNNPERVALIDAEIKRRENQTKLENGA